MKRIRLKGEYAWLQAAVLLVLAVSYIGYKVIATGPREACAARDTREEWQQVSRVVDGDTLKLANGERVRLIGIDTPETHESAKLLRDARKSGKDARTIQAQGKRASDFTKSLVAGRKVRLEYDTDRRDRYGRTLAYVYLEDGTFVNAKIVEEGYATVYTFPPNVKYADLLLRLQREAREKKKGLWGE